MNILRNFAASVFACIFAKQFMCFNMIKIICSYFKSLKIFRTAILEPLRSHFAKIAHKVAKSKYFQKFKLNRNLQKILFKMMYNMSMLRHWFSNERWGGGAELTFLSYSVKVCTHFFSIRNSFVRNLYWDGQIAKKLSVLKPQMLRNF